MRKSTLKNKRFSKTIENQAGRCVDSSGLLDVLDAFH